jgi:hypothetical protein
MSYLILYVPITLVVLAVLEGCRSDDPAKIFKRCLSNFGVLTAALAMGSVVVYFVNRYL